MQGEAAESVVVMLDPAPLPSCAVGTTFYPTVLKVQLQQVDDVSQIVVVELFEFA